MTFSNDDGGLPDEAFTELERAAGVPGIIRGNHGSKSRYTETSAEVTEEDCIALIVRSVVMQDLGSFALEVVSPHDDLGVEYDFCNLAGLDCDSVRTTDYSLLVHDYPISVQMMLNALRKSGLPLFWQTTQRPWLAWDDASQCLDTNLQYQGGHLRRCFLPGGLDRETPVPKEPERARIYKLLRTAYLSSDYGKRPLLIHNSHLDDALAKKAVPFEEPRPLGEAEFGEYSLVYFTHTGEVTSVPLSKACEEKVTVATRTASYFGYDGWRPLSPSLVENVLWANSFRMSVQNNSQKFRYYLRRNKGTVFQSTFEQIDIPSEIQLWYSRPDSVAERAAKISEWAAARNARVFLTVNCHPLQFNDCEQVTTPEHYANAVKKLAEHDFTLNNSSSGDSVAVVWASTNKLARFSEGPYVERWKPVGA